MFVNWDEKKGGDIIFCDVNQMSCFCFLIIFRVCVSVLAPIPSCEAGHVQPMFLSKTPSQGDVLYATVGKKFLLHAQAQAHHARYS